VRRGQNIHRGAGGARQLARHYHQSYQVRRFRSWTPELLLQHAVRDEPLVHLFDEPQLNTQDGYVGFMLRFFRELRRSDRLVFVCLHPNEPWHLDLLCELAEGFVFVSRGQVAAVPDFNTLLAQPGAREYLDRLVHPQGEVAESGAQ
jgi:hypothetical protein